MLGCDISDQLLDQDCLTYTSTAKKSDLSTLLVRTEKVNNFNTSFQQLLLCGRRTGSEVYGQTSRD